MNSTAKFIILLGPPGAGKGTQAKILHQRFGMVHVASGDLFRENIAKQTPLGVLAKSFMDKGELVPDDVTVRMVMERIAKPDCARGVVFDGFPRTDAQAQALDAALARENKKIGAVLWVNVRDQELVARLSARWICSLDGAVYNLITNPPRVAGKCDLDDSSLVQRDDDKPAAVQRRLQVFNNQTKPLLEYYRAAGLVHEIQGEQPIDRVQADIVRVAEKL
ncbi:MAG: adenylate kinase [Chloroflexi bacterium]|nr:adenylate kinase [Chloroflexota bacterium]